MDCMLGPQTPSPAGRTIPRTAGAKTRFDKVGGGTPRADKLPGPIRMPGLWAMVLLLAQGGKLQAKTDSRLETDKSAASTIEEMDSRAVVQGQNGSAATAAGQDQRTELRLEYLPPQKCQVLCTTSRLGQR